MVLAHKMWDNYNRFLDLPLQGKHLAPPRSNLQNINDAGSKSSGDHAVDMDVLEQQSSLDIFVYNSSVHMPLCFLSMVDQQVPAGKTKFFQSIKLATKSLLINIIM